MLAKKIQVVVGTKKKSYKKQKKENRQYKRNDSTKGDKFTDFIWINNDHTNAHTDYIPCSVAVFFCMSFSFSFQVESVLIKHFRSKKMRENYWLLATILSLHIHKWIKVVCSKYKQKIATSTFINRCSRSRKQQKAVVLRVRSSLVNRDFLFVILHKLAAIKHICREKENIKCPPRLKWYEYACRLLKCTNSPVFMSFMSEHVQECETTDSNVSLLLVPSTTGWAGVRETMTVAVNSDLTCLINSDN